MARINLDMQALPSELIALQKQLASAVAKTPRPDSLPIGSTPHDCIYQRDRLKLLHYPASGEQRLGTPLLICYALVNRPYILDLLPGHSLIEGLCAAGVDVYLIDWGYPDAADSGLSLADYVLDYLDDCVQRCCAHAGVGQVNLLGVCQGGVLSLCYAALRPVRLRNLVTMITPVDFHAEAFSLSRLLREVDVDLLARRNLSGDLLNRFFAALKPLSLGYKKYLDNADLAEQPEALGLFAAMEQWIADSPDLAAGALHEFVEGCFQRNLLLADKLEIDGARVDLRMIELPLLNIYALRDHLVPPAASGALAGATGSTDYREMSWDTGHIGIYVSRRAVGEVPVSIAAWLRERDLA
jgi:polyhydroxyalkanoate synthase